MSWTVSEMYMDERRCWWKGGGWSGPVVNFDSVATYTISRHEEEVKKVQKSAQPSNQVIVVLVCCAATVRTITISNVNSNSQPNHSRMTTHHTRQHPIILITGKYRPSDIQLSSDLLTPTGTPGTGKTLHSTLLSADASSSSSPVTHLNIGDIVKDKGFYEGYDQVWQSYTVDEDRLLDHLEEVVNPQDGPAPTGTSDPTLIYDGL